MIYLTPETLPGDVAQIAETNHLGPFLRTYNSHSLLAVGCLNCLNCLSVIGGILVAPTSHGMFITGWSGILLTLLSVVMLLTGLRLLHYNREISAVFLFEKGIIYDRGTRLTVLLWSQIVNCEIHQESNTKRGRCIMRTKDGQTIPIGRLIGYEELGDYIQTAVEAHEECTL